MHLRAGSGHSDTNYLATCVSDVSGLQYVKSARVVPLVIPARQPDSLRCLSHVNSVSGRVASLGVRRYLQIASVPLISLTDAAEFILN